MARKTLKKSLKKSLKGGEGPKEGEIEVYRVIPIEDKCYITVFRTREEGDWRNRRYYSSLEPKYVGKYIKSTYEWAARDGSGIVWTFFNDMTNEEVEVRDDYEGRTCFKEVDCEEDKLKLSKRHKMLALSNMLKTDNTPTKMLVDQPNLLENINSYMGGRKKKKSLKGGVRLETVFPRDGRNDEEYATFLNGRRLPEYQWRVPPRRNGERNTAYIGRVSINAARVRHSPIDEDYPYPPTPTTTPPQPSPRRRNKTKSAPAVNKKKSRRSSMKLAAKGSYKRRRNSAPTRRKLSSAKAKDYLRILKKR